ncbi:Guanyl-specific ribonuclease Sa [Streptomyces sp. TLI_053]|uniref:ribonuclease domain-containing protein n=1 Tax=Streptomyces sp. TLI_053 TaxID=1855352 RepID=UPI00087B247D|nr:ribonuclease domain-containing protein [Streptomyces sp. TLI_053]SDT75232.1 Guanyl-specific ribonuclease Sa [Streptomyces sp. TLI_053]
MTLRRPAWGALVLALACSLAPAAPAPAAAPAVRAVLQPPLPVEEFPGQVERACHIWRGIGWPINSRPVDFRIPGPAYIRGSNPYGNRSGDLPSGGAYHEYDVNPRPTPATHRDAERLVRDDNSERTWYTDDHYANFREISGGC